MQYGSLESRNDGLSKNEIKPIFSVHSVGNIHTDFNDILNDT